MPDCDPRIASARSRSTSSIRNFSAMGRSASSLRKACLLSRMRAKSGFIFPRGIVAQTAANRQSSHGAGEFLVTARDRARRPQGIEAYAPCLLRCFKRDGSDVLAAKDTHRCSFHIPFHGRRQGFLQKSSAGRKELDRPTGNHHVLAFHLAATVAQVFENRLRAYKL